MGFRLTLWKFVIGVISSLIPGLVSSEDSKLGPASLDIFWGIMNIQSIVAKLNNQFKKHPLYDESVIINPTTICMFLTSTKCCGLNILTTIAPYQDQGITFKFIKGSNGIL